MVTSRYCFDYFKQNINFHLFIYNPPGIFQHLKDYHKMKGHIVNLYCDVPTVKVIFKGEQMHVRI